MAAGSSSAGGGASLWLMLLVLMVVMYFMMIRPQQKRNRKVSDMQSSLGPGDEVVTVGGLYGTIHSVDDDTVLLEIAPDVVARYARAAISRVLESAADGDEADEPEETDESEAESEAEANNDIVSVEKPAKSD